MPRMQSPPPVWMEELEGRACLSAVGPADPDLQALIIDHEGEVLWVYPDPVGNPTIGAGFNLAAGGAAARLKRAGLDYDAMIRTWEMTRTLWLHSGHTLRELRTDNPNRRKWDQFVRDHPPQKALTRQQSRKLLEMVLDETISDAQRQVAMFDELGHDPQTAIVDMVYNLGPAGFSRFRRLIADVNRGDMRGAASEMENSRWARQVGPRRLGDDVRRIQAGKSAVAKDQQSSTTECDGSSDQVCSTSTHESHGGDDAQDCST